MVCEDKSSRNNKSIKEIVELILSTDKRSRNDDNWLTYRVLRHYSDIYIPLEDFKKLPSFAAIRRERQRIQNIFNRYQPTNRIGKRKANERFRRSIRKDQEP